MRGLCFHLKTLKKIFKFHFNFSLSCISNVYHVVTEPKAFLTEEEGDTVLYTDAILEDFEEIDIDIKKDYRIRACGSSLRFHHK